MIEFTCRCGNLISAASELAGGLVQCPQCKRLNDVPLPSDLANLDDKGIYKLDTPPPRPSDNPQRVAELTTLFTRDRFDTSGAPIDLRSDRTGRDGPVPVESLGPLDNAPPKYDPVTGELIRDIDVKPDTPASKLALPVAKKVQIAPTRIDGIDIPKDGEEWLIPARLLQPVNILVMGIIVIAHIFAAGMMLAIAAFYWILVPFWFILHLLFLAHYGNVIDETGPDSKTDLPTPLRNVDWHDDTFGPFAKVLSALLISYGPGFLLLLNAGKVPPQLLLPLSGVLTIIGTLLFPALLLTTTTSGSLLNLRPDRVFGVIYVIGVQYGMLVPIWIGASLFLGFGIIGTNMLAAVSVADVGPAPRWMSAPVVIGALVAGTFLMHLFCCYLGLLYRKHHAAFPWVYQRFTGQRKRNMALGFPVAAPRNKKPAIPRANPIPRATKYE